MKILLLAAIVLVAGCATAPPTATTPADTRLAIGGHIVTPSGVQRDSWIVIENGRIAAIQKEKPAIANAAPTMPANFVIYCRLIFISLLVIGGRWIVGGGQLCLAAHRPLSTAHCL